MMGKSKLKKTLDEPVVVFTIIAALGYVLGYFIQGAVVATVVYFFMKKK